MIFTYYNISTKCLGAFFISLALFIVIVFVILVCFSHSVSYFIFNIFYRSFYSQWFCIDGSNGLNTVCFSVHIYFIIFPVGPGIRKDPEKRRLNWNRSFSEFQQMKNTHTDRLYIVGMCRYGIAWKTFLCFFRWPKEWCRLSFAYSIYPYCLSVFYHFF